MSGRPLFFQCPAFPQHSFVIGALVKGKKSKGKGKKVGSGSHALEELGEASSAAFLCL